MEIKRSKKTLPLTLCMLLIAAMTLAITGCNGGTDKETPARTEETTNVQAEEKTNVRTEETANAQAEEEINARTQEEADAGTGTVVLGEGSTVFDFSVVDKEGVTTDFEIHTDKETVGEALLELELIDGEESEYGLYVKTVNGITADYDKDGVYWAFYINGEYASTGVSETPVTEGETYSFKVE